MSCIPTQLGNRFGEGLSPTRHDEFCDDKYKRSRAAQSDSHLTRKSEGIALGQQYGQAVEHIEANHTSLNSDSQHLGNGTINGSLPAEKHVSNDKMSPSTVSMSDFNDSVPPNRSPPSPQPVLSLYPVQDDQETSSVSQHTENSHRIDNLAMSGTAPSTPTRDHPISISPLPFQTSRPLPPPGPGPGPGPSVKSPVLNSPDLPPDGTVVYQTRSHVSHEKQWMKIKRLRAEVWGLRSKIHETRRILREKQFAKSKADDNFFKYVRKQVLETDALRTPKEQSTLEVLLRDCEIARDEYGPLEDDCNLLESELGNQEYMLQKLESKFYDRPIDLPTSQLEELGIAPRPLNSSAYTESEISQQFHPLVTEYLSKMGDVDIIRERLDWNVDEKETLDEEKDRRSRVGLELAPPDQQWLDNYLAAEAELLAQLDQAEKEAEKLRSECFSRGLIDEDGNPTDFEHRERQTFGSDVNAGMETSEYVKFPTLIPPPGGKQVELRELGQDDGPDTNEDTVTTRLRVDRWLLHQLQMSVLDVNLLAQTYRLHYGDIEDQGRWQDDVLENWFADSGEELDRGPRTLSSGLFTQALPANEFPSSSTSEASWFVLLKNDQLPSTPHPEPVKNTN